MIDVSGLVKSHGDHPVLRGVDLTVAQGEATAIIGASGSGKSTLVRCINGLETFDEGKVAVDGLDLCCTLSRRERERTVRAIRLRAGMVFQQYNLFPHRTILENVIEGPVHVLKLGVDEAIERARKLLDRVGLGDRADSRPRELSGGQQQRVAIARALAMKPRVMLFDEPTSALDPRMTLEVVAVIKDLASDGLTMIVVTHEMAFARNVAQTVHVLDEGKIVESGPICEVFENPQSQAARGLLNHVEAA